MRDDGYTHYDTASEGGAESDTTGGVHGGSAPALGPSHEAVDCAVCGEAA